MFSPTGLGLAHGDAIDILAQRWTRAAQVYLDHPEALHLVRYEDFLADKQRGIERLAGKLGLPVVADIAPQMDLQFQPRGDNSQSWRSSSARRTWRGSMPGAARPPPGSATDAARRPVGGRPAAKG